MPSVGQRKEERHAGPAMTNATRTFAVTGPVAEILRMVRSAPPVVSANRVTDAWTASVGRRRTGRHARPMTSATRAPAVPGPVAHPIWRMVRTAPPIVSANRVTDAWTASVGRRRTGRHARPTTNATRATDAWTASAGSLRSFAPRSHQATSTNAAWSTLMMLKNAARRQMQSHVRLGLLSQCLGCFLLQLQLLVLGCRTKVGSPRRTSCAPVTPRSRRHEGVFIVWEGGGWGSHGD
eukprot:740775-Rhodomonas_salina.1